MMANDEIHKDIGPFWLEPTLRLASCRAVVSQDCVTSDCSKVTCVPCLDRGPSRYRKHKESDDGH